MINGPNLARWLPPDTPGDGVPSLAVASQEVLSDTVMYVYPADVAAFARLFTRLLREACLCSSRPAKRPCYFP
ncbi:MAG: hypothetical protein LBF62_13895 [Tannerellaceae bacterium]|nr:hypothetical protein [Tannerellaceae bacterium]